MSINEKPTKRVRNNETSGENGKKTVLRQNLKPVAQANSDKNPRCQKHEPDKAEHTAKPNKGKT